MRVAVLLIRARGDGTNVFRAAATSIFGVVPALMLVLGAFYCDWILAALVGSLIGVPSGDTAFLYWVSARIRDCILLKSKVDCADLWIDLLRCQTNSVASDLTRAIYTADHPTDSSSTCFNRFSGALMKVPWDHSGNHIQVANQCRIALRQI